MYCISTETTFTLPDRVVPGTWYQYITGKMTPSDGFQGDVLDKWEESCAV